MYNTISTRGMTRDQWLKARRQGIGGSDAAALMGDNKYKTPLSVYYDKVSETPLAKDEPREAMRLGAFLEDYVARRFTEETGKKVRRSNQIYAHPDMPYMIGNIDRLVVGESAGLECKTTDSFIESELTRGIVPLYYQWQCIHYMLVTGLPTWYLAILANNRTFHVFKLSLLDYAQQADALIMVERTFWTEHVVPRVPPYPTGKRVDNDVIAALYPSDSEPGDEATDLTPIKETLDILPLLKNAAENAKDAYEKERQAVRMALQGRVFGRGGGWYVSDTLSVQERVDSKRLRVELPDVYSRYTKNVPTQSMKIKKEA